MNSTTRRHIISNYAAILTNWETPVTRQREAILQIESLLKDEKEFMDKSKTASECVGYEPPTMEKDAYVKKLRLLQAQCNELLSACARQAAFDELQTLMYNDKWKFERAADIERKEAMLKRAVSVTELECNIDEFLKDREYYRTRCSHDGLAANKEYDRGLCDLIKKYIRHSLKLPTL